jgi:hypothetical protein
MFEGGAERLSAAQRPNRLPRESTADIILTTEAPGTAADRRFSKPRPTVGRSYRFSFGDGMHSLLRHLLIVAGGSHHSRARDRQLSPPSSPVDHLPSLLGGGSAVLGVETGHRARRSRRRWSPPGSLQRQPQHTTPGSLVPLVPARHRRRPASRWWQIRVALAGPCMVEWFWVAIVVVSRVAEAHRQPHGVPSE